MAISLAVLLLPILLIVLLFQYLGRDTEVVVVDPGPSIAEAERAGLPVATPEELSDDWKPTSAVVRRDDGAITLRIGYVTPSGGFAQVVQSDADAEPLLRRELGEGKRPIGTERIRGQAWQRYPGRKGEAALVLLEPNRTILVLGSAPIEELRALARALR